jgi:catechol 2,3-dioxygenase-like lactoylglutathione lyase family enzyme
MKAIRHFGIVVSNIEKSLHFYRDLLGLEIKIDALEKGKFIDDILNLKNVKVRTIKMSADDGNLIELLWYKSHLKKPNKKEICGIGASHVAFTVDNLDYEYKRLKKQKVKFSCPPRISPDGRAKVTFCYDPDGTPIELVEELKK